MRYLKKKLALAQQKYPERISLETKKEAEFFDSLDETFSLDLSQRTRSSPSNCAQSINTDLIYQSSSLHSTQKKIFAEYNNAILSFVLSDLALPYLEPIFQDEKKRQEFQKLITSQRSSPNKNTIFKNLRRRESDSEQESLYKKALLDACEKFIKFFSVNWIMNSKLDNKILYLKSRFRILRKIKSPQNHA